MSFGEETSKTFEAYLEEFCSFLEIMTHSINKFEPSIFNQHLTRFKGKYFEYKRALGRLQFLTELMWECKEDLSIRYQEQMPYLKKYYNWVNKQLLPLPPGLKDMGKMSQRDELIKMTLYLLLKFLYRTAYCNEKAVYLGGKVVWFCNS